MVTISEELDNAFNADERQIKAFANIYYDTPEVEDGSATYYVNLMTGLDGQEVVDYTLNDNQVQSMLNAKEMTLERNRLLLNGTFMFFDKAKENNLIGAVRYEPVQTGMTDYGLNFQVNATLDEETEYVTIYFSENVPRYIRIMDFTNMGPLQPEPILLAEITDNNELQTNIRLSQKLTSGNKILRIYTDDYINSNIRPRIKRIEFGFIAKYDENDIITMEVTEQVKKFCEETPENELVLTLNNNQGQFDVLNPEGITKYLNENIKIKPYIGAITTNGVEYVSMGIYYLESWTNENDNTTTFLCKNLMKKLKELEFKKVEGIDGPLSYVNTIRYIDNIPYIDYETGIKNYLKNVYDINNDIDFNMEEDIYYNMYINLINLSRLDDIPILEYLQNISISTKDILYVDRNDTLIMRRLNIDINGDIEQNMLLNEAEIKKIDDINDVKITFNDVNDTTSGTRETMSISHKLNNTEEIIKISTDYKKEPTRLLNISNGNVSILEYNSRIIFYKITGNIGDTVTFDQEYEKYVNGRNETFEYLEEGKENILEKEKKILEINGKGMSVSIVRSSTNTGKINSRFIAHYLYTQNNEEINCITIGNPKYEAGDVLSIYTKYRYENMFIESITYKYDGGLTAEIKGKDFYNLS